MVGNATLTLLCVMAVGIFIGIFRILRYVMRDPGQDPGLRSRPEYPWNKPEFQDERDWSNVDINGITINPPAPDLSFLDKKWKDLDDRRN